jgi:arginyl-tRNA synthetase
MIDVFGADHHGYVPRVKAAAQALGFNDDAINVLLVQFATLYRGQEKISMSTRGGDFVTLRQLREEVGKDAARFFYVLRKSNQHMDFDLELAKSQTNDNPVHYVQYAHARVSSVFDKLETKLQLSFDQAQGEAALAKLDNTHEQQLLNQLQKYPEVLKLAARDKEPHQLAYYLRDLANFFHTYYNDCQFIVDDEHLRNARLCLVKATQQVLKNGLALIGVSAPEQM